MFQEEGSLGLEGHGGTLLNEEQPPTPAEALREVLDYAKDYFPEHYELFRGRLNHVYRRYGYVFAGAVAACEVLGVLLGI